MFAPFHEPLHPKVCPSGPVGVQWRTAPQHCAHKGQLGCSCCIRILSRCLNVLEVFQRSREQCELQFTKTLHHPILYVIYISKYIALYEIDSNSCLCSNETDEFCVVVFSTQPEGRRLHLRRIVRATKWIGVGSSTN